MGFAKKDSLFTAAAAIPLEMNKRISLDIFIDDEEMNYKDEDINVVAQNLIKNLSESNDSSL